LSSIGGISSLSWCLGFGCLSSLDSRNFSDIGSFWKSSQSGLDQAVFSTALPSRSLARYMSVFPVCPSIYCRLSGSSAERIVWMAQAGGGVCVAIELVESQWMTKCYKRLPRKHSMTSLIRVISASKDTSDCIGFRRYGMETKHREKLGVRGDHAFQIESKYLVVGKFWFGGILIVNTSGLKSVHSSWESGLQTVRIFFSVRAGTAASSKQETVGVLRGH
jgi:hypothetical protein